MSQNDKTEMIVDHLENENDHEISISKTKTIGDGTVATNDEVLRNLSMAVPQLGTMSEEAKLAIDVEHKMGVVQAIRAYPKAVFYSMVLSMCLVMEGYDTALLGNFYALQQFNKKFGVPVGDGTYQVTAPWQSGLQNGAQVGSIMGLMVAGILADRFGYKRVLLGNLLLMIATIFMFFFAQNIGMLFAAELIAGVPWGAFQTLTTTYAADVCPIALRPVLTTFVNMCWVIGQLIAAGVLRGVLKRTDQWAWRIPYAVQWVWPLPIICGVLFAPESPYWLVRRGRFDDARRSLRTLASGSISDSHVTNTLSMIQHTNELELQLSEGTSYWDCLKGVNRRRTEIACMAYVIQVFSGIWFGGNVVYFLIQAGFNAENSFNFGLGTNGIALVGTVATWFIMPKVGRRRLYITGLSIMFTILLAVGFMGIPPAGIPAIGYASGSIMMIFVLTYDLTVGPVAYCLIAEIPSTRLRIKTAVLARNSYNIASIIANLLNPPILNPTAWNLRGKGGFIWCGFCLCSLIWSLFRLPEPKGLSPAELDVLFESKISARKFRTVDVDPFRSAHLKVDAESDADEKRETFVEKQ